MKYLKNPKFWIRYWFKYKFIWGVKTKTKKAVRNVAPRPYVKPKLTIYNTQRRGPYASNRDFDESFNEIPDNMPIGGMINITVPEDK